MLDAVGLVVVGVVVGAMLEVEVVLVDVEVLTFEVVDVVAPSRSIGFSLMGIEESGEIWCVAPPRSTYCVN